jgi:hypothetical protein
MLQLPRPEVRPVLTRLPCELSFLETETVLALVETKAVFTFTDITDRPSERGYTW